MARAMTQADQIILEALASPVAVTVANPTEAVRLHSRLRKARLRHPNGKELTIRVSGCTLTVRRNKQPILELTHL